MGAWRSGLALPLTMVRQAAALRYIGARPCPSLVTGTLFSDDGRATAGNLGQAGYQRRGSGWHDQPPRASPAEIRHDYVCRSITRVQRIASKPTISRRHAPKGCGRLRPPLSTVTATSSSDTCAPSWRTHSGERGRSASPRSRSRRSTASRSAASRSQQALPLFVPATDKNGGKSRRFCVRNGNASDGPDGFQQAAYISKRFPGFSGA
ncbi:MAG: hypothetical protein JWN21_1307 [Sphingomonas bacterium]|nr:hypothetical protein [Sphingomonas bacterium]